jgi:hypothetical protein
MNAEITTANTLDLHTRRPMHLFQHRCRYRYLPTYTDVKPSCSLPLPDPDAMVTDLNASHIHDTLSPLAAAVPEALLSWAIIPRVVVHLSADGSPS